MAAKKRKRAVTQEPLLNTVARKLGHAAGTITNMTHEIADNVSAMPETVAAKVRQAVKIGESAGSARGRIRHARKKLSRAVRRGKTRTVAAGAAIKRRLPRQKALRRKVRASKLQK
jgi:hypothetical protein